MENKIQSLKVNMQLNNQKHNQNNFCKKKIYIIIYKI